MRLTFEIVVAVLLVLHVARASSPSSAAWAQQPFDPLPSIDLAALRPSDFTDDELDLPLGGNNADHGLPYLLAHFKAVADAVSDGSPGKPPRGFIDLVVWRGRRDNQPHNMRVMENNLALAYFYVTDRPWNVYRGHPGVRQRLEAAFAFMLAEQSPDGAFSEYVPRRWGLAPTAFQTKFLGQTLTLLKRPGAPPIDPDLLERVVRMQRKAILFVLTDPAFYEHGKRFTNQFGNVWAGGLAYVDTFPHDTEILDKLFAKYAATHEDFFSPAGFPYENDGPDWGYNLGTHASNQRMAWHYARRDASHPMRAGLVREERAFVEWLSYNAVPLPDGSGFVLNRAIETRGDTALARLAESAFGDEIELVRAFAPTDAEVAARRASIRRETELRWPKVDPLEVGTFSAYSPYDFLHREHASSHPTAAQRDAARAKLPYVARDRFTHQRVDGDRRRDPAPAYTFVRRPGYYAAFNSGNQRNDQRLGLGLLWHPTLGALIQSQTGSDAHAWGTRLALEGSDTAEAHLFESRSITAAFTVTGQPSPVRPGVRDLPAGDVVATYALQYGPGPDGTKRVTFHDDRIEVAVTEPRAFREQIPLLLLPDDQLSIEGSTVTLRRGVGVLRLAANGATRITRMDGRAAVGPYRVVSVHLQGSAQLDYTLQVSAD